MNKDNGLAPLAVTFSSAGTSDPDGDPLTYAWDFDNNGTTDSTAANPSFTYTTNGAKQARLTVSDRTGRSGTRSCRRGRQQPPDRHALRPPGRRLFDWTTTSRHGLGHRPAGRPDPTARRSSIAAAARPSGTRPRGGRKAPAAAPPSTPARCTPAPTRCCSSSLRASYTDNGATGSVPLTGSAGVHPVPEAVAGRALRVAQRPAGHQTRPRPRAASGSVTSRTARASGTTR